VPARLTLHPSDRKAGGESGLYAQLTAGSQEPRNRAAPARCRLGSQMLGELARSVAPAPLAQALVALDGVLAKEPQAQLAGASQIALQNLRKILQIILQLYNNR